jgi:hypothetical protein
MHRTVNLDCALQRLRDTRGARTLWIDALCIDQNNTEEKNRPVAIMGEIYRNSSQVLIWLGEHELDEVRGELLDGIVTNYKSPITWSSLNQAYETIVRLQGARTVPECYEMALAALMLMSHDVHITEIPFFPREHFTRELSEEESKQAISVSDQPWMTEGPLDLGKYDNWRNAANALILLMSRSYWMRTWIIQEVVLGPNPLVPFGGHIVSLETLVQAE